MWKAAKLMPTKYGGEKSLEEEDDTRLVIGDIGEDQLREADAIVAAAASLSPEAGVVALMDSRVQEAESHPIGEVREQMDEREKPAKDGDEAQNADAEEEYGEDVPLADPGFDSGMDSLGDSLW